jgi:amidase
VFGLKPSFGVVSQRGYLDHVGGGTTDADINVFGPIARSAEDLDLLLSVLAGPEPDAALAWRCELPEPRHAGVEALRVGVWFEEPACPIDRDELTVLRRAVDALAGAGAKVEDAHPAVEFGEQNALFTQMIMGAISPSMPPETADAVSGTHLQWLRAAETRERFRRAWAEWFERFDVLLCPVLPTPAFPHNQDGDGLSRRLIVNGEEVPYLNSVLWTGLIGIVGLPSAVPPIGRTSGGLPVGVQVVTPFLRDREAIQVAGVLAELSGGYQVPPGFA